MIRLTDRLFNLGLRAFPNDFRARHGPEMRDVFHARGADVSLAATVQEAADLCISGLRMRLEARHAHRPALMMLTAAAMVTTTLIVSGTNHPVPSSIDFSASYPSGPFTITIVDGRAVEATINSKRLDRNRIVAERDSIRLLREDGSVAVAVAFDADKNAIAWIPRAAAIQ
jgi:hypothetical protein